MIRVVLVIFVLFDGERDLIGIGAFRFQSTSKSLQKHSFVAAGWLVALLKLSLKKSKQDILRTEE